MSNESASSSGSRFAADLRQIREERGLTIEALHEETKIPLEIITKFEQTGLLESAIFNRVYLRSLVRSYAEVVGVSPAVAVEAMEEALEGRYDGRLTRLDEVPEEIKEQETEEALAPETASAGTFLAEPEGVDEDPAYEEEESYYEEVEAVYDEGPTYLEEEDAAAATWAAQSPPPKPGERPAPTTRAQPERRPQQRRQSEGVPPWAWFVGGLVAIALLGWLLLRVFGGEGDGTTQTQPVAVQDTTTAAPDTTATTGGRSGPAPELGPTIDLTVVAANGPVSGIRLQRDEDERRPYWIEVGQAKTFPAQQRVTLEEFVGEINDMQLLVEGFPYALSTNQPQIVFDRETAQAFLDTVSVQRVQLTVVNDTTPKGPIRSQ